MRINTLSAILVVAIIGVAALNVALLERPTTLSVVNVSTATTTLTSTFVLTTVSNSEIQTLQSEVSSLNSHLAWDERALNLNFQTNVSPNNLIIATPGQT